METVYVTKNKEHIIATDAMIGEVLQPGLDIRINIYQLVGTVESIILSDQALTESVQKPGVYHYAYTWLNSGNYRVDFYEATGEYELSKTFALVKITETDIDNVFGAADPHIQFGTIQTVLQGDTLVSNVSIYDFFGGTLTDPDGIPEPNPDNLTLDVIVRDPNGVTREIGKAEKITVGSYRLTYPVGSSSKVGAWSLEWIFSLGGTTLPSVNRTEVFNVSLRVVSSCSDTRKGFAFKNPDITANDGWGAIITPDELRYIYGFGNDLVAPNSASITDDVLECFYIRNAIANVERDLNVKFQKRVYKHRDIPGQAARDLSGYGTLYEDYEWEEPYDFSAKEYQEYIFIKLRKKPILSVESASFRDVSGGLITDLMQWIRINHMKGSVEFFPNEGSFALYAGAIGKIPLVRSVLEGRGRYPDAYFIDYTAGFESVEAFRKTWPELTQIVGQLAAINMLNDYGDGKTPGLASSSIGLAGISESFGTTQSATNALFGARILQFEKQIKNFYDNNKLKYAGMRLGAL
jgi:hypothetical protein